MNRTRKVPLRQCIACRTKRPKRELMRIVRTGEGELLLDHKGKMPGRGAYICVSAACLNKAVKEGLFARHLEVKPGPALLAELEYLLGDRPD
mgnify:FL=1